MTAPRPLAEFWDLLPLAPGTAWREARNDEVAGLGSGETLATELATPLWAADVVCDWDEWDDARRLAAMVRSFDGPMRSFLMTNPVAEYPAGDPGGLILADAEVAIL